MVLPNNEIILMSQGNDLVREILSWGVVSRWKMHKDIGVQDKTIQNWVRDIHEPSEENLEKIKLYYFKVKEYKEVLKLRDGLKLDENK